MSADNWGICPKCKRQRIQAAGKADRQAKDAYGKVSEAEYLKLVEDAQKLNAAALKPSGEQNTLREDYKIGTNENGIFTVHYACSCRHCGFQFEFKHSQEAFAPKEDIHP